VAVGIACLVSVVAGCAHPGSADRPAAATTATSGSCTPSDAQTAALTAYHTKAFDGYLPDGVQLKSQVDRTADCTIDWGNPKGLFPSTVRFVQYEIDYTSSKAITSAQIKISFGVKATESGWQANGAWDDSLGDGSAYANYCQKIDDVWAALSIHREPAQGSGYPVQVIVEGFPRATACPGRPQDG
jgi:hypothetical protein